MSLIQSAFSKDMVLDEAAFEAAARDFEALGQRITDLNTKIEDMLETLKTGFDTPAGAKFIQSCENNLRQPMNDQMIVIKHISDTLREVKGKYQSVFNEYAALNRTLQQYQT